MLPNCHLGSGSEQGLPRFLGRCPLMGCDRISWVVKCKPAILQQQFNNYFSFFFFFSPCIFPLPHLISAVATYVTTISK